MHRNQKFCLSWLGALVLYLGVCSAAVGAKKAEVTVGAKYKTNLMERGAIFYKNWQVLPVIYFGFLENRLQVTANKVEYNDFLVDDVIRGRTGFQLFSDDFFIETGAERTVRNSRNTTIEWVNALEFFLPNYFDNVVTVQLWVAKDFDEHKGIYAKLDFAASIIKFWGDGALALIEPQVFANIGFGDSKHNLYLYGSNVPSESALTDFEVGLRIVSPIKFDRYFPSFELSYFSILEENLKSGNLLVNDTDGYRAELTLAINIY